jgi:hypothetical protein
MQLDGDMSRKPSPEEPHADRSAADRGRPDEYPPNPPEEASTIHDERTGQQSDNDPATGKVTSPPGGDLP